MPSQRRIAKAVVVCCHHRRI